MDETPNVCLCHDMKWRAKYHFIMNRLHGRLQQVQLKRIARVICACQIDNAGPNSSKQKLIQETLAERWAAVSTESLTAAKPYFEHFIAEQDPCEEFHGFLKNFRDQMFQAKLLSNRNSSASRFLYILQQLLQNSRCSILDPIATNPQARKINKEVIVLSALRDVDVGNFIGRKGVRLRKIAVKGSKIDIKFNAGTKNVEAHIVCPEAGMQALKERLEKESKILRESRDQHEEAVAKYQREKKELARGGLAGLEVDSNDEEDDDDDDDDDD
ncbi:uncharacterized protein LOC117337579 [Pecten maximus]|uniref:uncharacterized protein LOC117337579 n=1 Tax=Pecten maximus TaxID=6579 RepID=UPI001458D22C|nr:uncharacterized protein LOC117337579 [Pecten maximus]